MQSTLVTSKGQMTIPKDIRHQLGIKKGSKINISIVGDHIELYVNNVTADISSTGFAMLKSKCKSIPTDFDPASLLDNDRT